MTGAEIITKFELYTDDLTELSPTEELDLLNKVYRMVLADRPWEFLKRPFSGTHSNGVVTLPDDFDYMYIGGGFTGIGEYGPEPCVYVGSQLARYKIINFDDRRFYNNTDGYCYINLADGTLVFTKAPTDTDVQFDYIYTPDDIALDTSPIFRTTFHYMLVHAMAVDDMILQLFEKARSYAPENNAKYLKYMENLSNWNSRFYFQ